MYGPLWIMFTLIVVIIINGHLVKLLRSSMGFGLGTEQDLADQLLIDDVIKRYGGVGTMVFDPSTSNANASLKAICRVFFMVLFFFAAVPFATYLTFMSSLQG